MVERTVNHQGLPQLHSWLWEKPQITFDDLKLEYDAMPVEERQRILREKYGLQLQGDEIVETPQLIADSLASMDSYIDDIEPKEAYETALFINPGHVLDPDFKLAFLRADSFDVHNAAQRMVAYWERKVELFGAERAFIPSVSTMDLLVQDYPALIQGGARWIPRRDEAGRAIIFRYMKYGVNSVDSMMRLNWFVLHSAIFDREFGEEFQKNGFVFLAGNGLVDRLLPFDSIVDMRKYLAGVSNDAENILPFKTKSMHVFFPSRNVIMGKLLEQLLSNVCRKIRLRLVFHDGSNTENAIRSLENYRIPRDSIPVELGGDLSFNYKQKIYEQVIHDVCTVMGRVSVDHLSTAIKELLFHLMET
mmetsp:Transcript_801/g.1269  ORF Transcript_801/g.1269 Transcript_801/m.1269 type:complete len:362 (+) Transcript_801:39-1124(+)